MAEPPKSPWQLTPTRIGILALVLLALVSILGATLGGGLSSYEQLREANTPKDQ